MREDLIKIRVKFRLCLLPLKVRVQLAVICPHELLDVLRRVDRGLSQHSVALRVVLLHPLPSRVTKHLVKHLDRIRLSAHVDVPASRHKSRVHLLSGALSVLELSHDLKLLRVRAVQLFNEVDVRAFSEYALQPLLGELRERSEVRMFLDLPGSARIGFESLAPEIQTLQIVFCLLVSVVSATRELDDLIDHRFRPAERILDERLVRLHV